MANADDSSKIWIGNDHGGYELKRKFVAFLQERGIPFEDAGAHSSDIVRYPHYAVRVAKAVSDGEAQRGILICSTGIGMSIIANKFERVRAALCTSADMGRLTRAHNDSNILCAWAGRSPASSKRSISWTPGWQPNTTAAGTISLSG